MREERVGGLRADDAHQLLASGAADAGQASERSQEHLAAARSDAGYRIELGAQVAFRARLAVERDREAVRLVANALNQQQCGTVFRQRNRILSIAREEQLFLLRNARRHQIGQTELLERGIRRGQLAFSAVDQDRSEEHTSELQSQSNLVCRL